MRATEHATEHSAAPGTPQLAVRGPVATITLRRPKLANRLELDDLVVLQRQIEEVNTMHEVRVLRLAARGRHFCSGFNIDAVGAEGIDAGALFEALADAMEQARPVTVAAIQGGVYGGATDLALACDFRIGTLACEMFVPATKLGLHFYRGGLERYVSRLGLGVAKQVLLAGARLDALAMQRCGFLDTLVDSAEVLGPEVDALTEQLLAMAPLALLAMKKNLNRIARGTLDLAELARDIALTRESADLREGQQAWQQKRAPRFVGR